MVKTNSSSTPLLKRGPAADRSLGIAKSIL